MAGRLTVASGTLEALRLEDASLDAVMTVNTFYYVDDQAAACTELARVVRAGGRVVIEVADPDVMTVLPFLHTMLTIRSITELTDALNAAGLDLAEHRRLSDRGTSGHHLLIARKPARSRS